MNWIFAITLVFCVVNIQTGFSEDGFGYYLRPHRQVNPSKKCNTCLSANECGGHQQVTDCLLIKVVDLFAKVAEPVKSFWTAIMAQPGANTSFADTSTYSECFTVQFHSADNKVGEFRSCSPAKLGTVEFCAAVNKAANVTKATLQLCKTCAVAEKPCNNEPPIIKPTTTTGKPTPNSALLTTDFSIFDIYFLGGIIAARFVL